VDSGIKPLDVSIIAAQRLIKSLYLPVKDSENFAGRIAVFEFGVEREKVRFCAFFVRFQGIVEDELEVG
jgi:hypothetical protein